MSRATANGLQVDERHALLGWARWIRGLWEDFTGTLGPRAEGLCEPWVPPGVVRGGSASLEVTRPESGVVRTGSTPSVGPLTWIPSKAPHADLRSLRRWARTTKRSRWPLLRSVVAESLRAATEPVRIDRLPLPTDRAVLLELVTLVKIVDHLAPSDAALRWLDLGAGSNTVRARGMNYRFQEPLSREEVLATHEYDHGLRETLKTVTSRLPKYIDGWLRFDVPRAGFDGILVEAKSGSQGLDAALYQLKVYRATLRARGVGRLLVLGVIESLGNEMVEPPSPEPEDDVWVFTGTGGISQAVRRWFG